MKINRTILALTIAAVLVCGCSDDNNGFRGSSDGTIYRDMSSGGGGLRMSIDNHGEMRIGSGAPFAPSIDD